MDLEDWLAALGLDEYAPAFAENRVTQDLLPDLTDQDLRDLGVTALGDRKRMLAAIGDLSQRKSDSEPAFEPTGPPRGERRQVTVLFADIAGFTAMSERLGAEAIHDLLNRYFATADAIIEEFGGAIDKHIGDNVMAVFGAPIAHDNDPERAVRAALAIHQAVREIDGLDGPLKLHIGIASGQVVASGTGSDSHREYTVTGDTVNLAARLEGLAEPGQTLISRAVHRRTSGLFTADALGPQDFKGIGDPVPVWRIDGVAEATGNGVADGAPETPFVGRRSELSQCRAILAEIAATGQGQALLLRGPAGIGKTRLSGEILRAAREVGFAVHRCLVLDFGSRKGQGAVPALVRSLLGVPGTASAEERGRASDTAIGAGACTEDARVFLNDLLDLPQPLDLRRLFDAMDDVARRDGRRALMAGLATWAARGQPQMILVEDLHWADAQTLDTLAAIMETASDHPVALLATTRPESDPLQGAWRAHSLEQPVSIINLGPLRASEAREMATGFARANRERLSECLERAAGNPLFLEQLLQNAAESTSDLVPGSIQSLVLARMDRLDEADRHALQAASIFGQRFPLAALCHLLDAPDYDCQALLTHQLIRPEGEDFLFAHALIRDGVYESILTAARIRLHNKAAAWFAGSDLVLHAEHLHMAGDPGAPRAYLDAAQAELVQYRNEQALALLEKGQALAAEAADLVDLALAMGEARHDTGDLAGARLAYTEALDAAAEDAARSRALLGLAGVKRITEDLDGALADLEKAEAAARRAGLAEVRGRIHHLRGNLLFPRGDTERCLREHRTALDLARGTGAAELEAAALGGLADGEYMRGHLRSACQRFTECVELARAHGFGRIEVANWPMIAVTADWCGDSNHAMETALGAIEAARRVGDARAELIAQDMAFGCYRTRGEFDRARPHIDRAIAIARSLGALRFEAECLCFLGHLDFVEGRRAAAMTHVHRALELARKTGMSFMGPAILGALMLITDDPSERQSAAAEAEALLTAGSVSHNHLYFRSFAIDACLRDRVYDEVERHADALSAFCVEDGMLLVEFLADRGRALARAGRGENSDSLTAELDRLIAAGERMKQNLALSALREARQQLGAASGT